MRAYHRWLARVEDESTPWTEQEIIYFRKAIGASGLKDPAERALLRSLFNNAKHIRITDEQSRKGQQYLLTNTLKHNGRFRKNAKLGNREIEILQNLDHHKFIGLYEYCNDHYYPVYEAVSKNGRYFQYVGAFYEHVRVVG